MHVTTTESADGRRQHMVVEVMPGGMAEQVGLNGGETLHRLNGMLVSRWSNEILQQQFRVIIPAAFQLTFIKPIQSKNGDPAMRMTKVSAAVYEDDSFVQIQVFSSTDRVSLDETEPGVCVDCSSRDSQLCFLEHRSTQTAVTMHSSRVTMDSPQTDDSRFNLTQVVFDVVDQPGQHCCVFVNETSDQDVVNCIVVTDRNHIAVTTTTSPETDIVTSTDPRFFLIHAVDELVCFESTELLDHYLAVRDKDVLVKFVANVEERNMDPEVLFRVGYRETNQSN
ncbi:hypothetical protein NP493_323g03001 [Ridgeia piscesae]|uniref:PDZ domain-containing protein n=1 Tax=Ridgeia piscesae TaxID=27915 RepID=A0AAD9L4A9_RIDPI|nr:hypothetical protein NP493_323g03001 [Ridgeia piscesae]